MAPWQALLDRFARRLPILDVAIHKGDKIDLPVSYPEGGRFVLVHMAYYASSNFVMPQPAPVSPSYAGTPGLSTAYKERGQAMTGFPLSLARRGATSSLAGPTDWTLIVVYPSLFDKLWR